MQENIKNKANTQGAVVRIVIWSVVLLILAGIFVLCLLTQLWGDGFGLISFGSSSYWYDENDGYQMGNADIAEHITDLDIDWLDGSLEIIVGDGENAVLTEENLSNVGDTLSQDDQLRWRVVDGCLEVKYCKPYFFWGIGEKIPEKKLVLTLPASMAETVLGEVEIQSTAADIYITGISVTSLDIDTVDGAMALLGLTADEVDIDGVDMTLNIEGNVRALDLDGVAVTMTYLGDLQEADLDGVDYQTTFTLTTVAKKIDVDTVDGEVTLYLPEDIGGFVVEADGVDCDVTHEGFEGVTQNKNHCTYGDKSLKITVDGVDCQLKIKKTTNN